MSSSRIVLHVDMDSFYVSVERLLDPSLVGKPVVVGGPPDSRGVVSSASYEARAFGVRSAMPCSQAFRLCPQAIFVSSGFGIYSKYSRLIAETLSTFTPLAEMASQDEAYLDMTGTERLWGGPLDMGRRIKAAIRDRTGLPCTVAGSANRLVSKIGTDTVKPDGLLWVEPGTEAAFLAPMATGKMPGIGPKTVERLRELGLRTLGDIQRLGRAECARLFGEHGDSLWERASGIDAAPVAAEAGPPRQISHETTFDRDISDAAALNAVLADLSDRAAERLRADGLFAWTISVKFRYREFETHGASRTLESPTHDPSVIRDEARALLAAKREPHRPLRLVGVACSNLAESDEGQMDLLDEGTGREKRERLWNAVDALRAKYGRGAVKPGGTPDGRGSG